MSWVCHTRKCEVSVYFSAVNFSTMKTLNIRLLILLVLFGVIFRTVYSGGLRKNGIGSMENIEKLNMNYIELAATLDKLVHSPRLHHEHGDDHPHQQKARHNDVNDLELQLFENLFNKIHSY